MSCFWPRFAGACARTSSARRSVARARSRPRRRPCAAHCHRACCPRALSRPPIPPYWTRRGRCFSCCHGARDTARTLHGTTQRSRSARRRSQPSSLRPIERPSGCSSDSCRRTSRCTGGDSARPRTHSRSPPFPLPSSRSRPTPHTPKTLWVFSTTCRHSTWTRWRTLWWSAWRAHATSSKRTARTSLAGCRALRRSLATCGAGTAR
mmetsp:Transcript_2657/g.10631  ORF Transcript_2657/g.10631 Transcript_2657/m.10631 type:complete len:207 (+) Transcript_2657:1458-2078(+)